MSLFSAYEVTMTMHDRTYSPETELSVFEWFFFFVFIFYKVNEVSVSRNLERKIQI